MQPLTRQIPMTSDCEPNKQWACKEVSNVEVRWAGTGFHWDSFTKLHSAIPMEVENYPTWKDTNIGDTPIFHWTMIMGGRVHTVTSRLKLWEVTIRRVKDLRSTGRFPQLLFFFWVPVPTKNLPSSKLTWQRKIPIFNREYIFNRSIFHWHVSLPEGRSLEILMVFSIGFLPHLLKVTSCHPIQSS